MTLAAIVSVIVLLTFGIVAAIGIAIDRSAER